MSAYPLRRLLWAGPLSTAAASLFVMAYYALTKSLGEQYLLPSQANSSLTVPMPAILPLAATLLAGLLAILLFGFLARFAHQPGIVFLSVCVAALVLSLGGPFNLPASNIQTKLLLSGMHVIAAGTITIGILGLSSKKINHQVTKAR